MLRRILTVALLAISITAGLAQELGTSLLDLNKLPFFYGREYFVLRSGRAQMIVQADRADLGPAFTYLLFDAQNARQSQRKDRAFNFVPDKGFASSALEVILGEFPFTALGHRTETRWTLHDGIPAVEAVWWAGGIRVTEHIFALQSFGSFQRSIVLEGAHLVGKESVKIRLSLPPGEVSRQGSTLQWNGPQARLALTVAGNEPSQILEAKGCLEIGPLEVAPNSKVALETILFLPLRSVADEKVEIRATPFTELRSRTRQKWTSIDSLETEDRTVREIYDKVRFGLPGMVADDGTMDAGIFEYGAQWVRDTSNTALGLIHTGEFELARYTLERVLTSMISQEGVTMIAGSFDTPDREQFDQMGEFMHVLKAYRDWTGDDSLIRNHRPLLLALVERPLDARFRDSTGMVHNRREFWERTFDDAYELAYQAWVIQGLRDAADLAPALGAEERTTRWRTEADRILKAMLSGGRHGLVDGGHLIKRRNITGEIADFLPEFKGFQPDVPGNTEKHHRLLPDASQALPIAFRIVDPKSDLARRTLDELEQLWNTRWSDGGYDRYHTSVQPDQPGPWPFATCFIMRAQHEAGLYDRSRRALEWLNTVQGGRAGAWFEEIPSVRSLEKACGLVPWTSGEIALFVVRHWLGVSFEGSRVVLRPALFPGSAAVRANLRFRTARLQLQIDGAGAISNAQVNGVTIEPGAAGALRLPSDFAGGHIIIHTK
jgi:hypothetical protein